MKQKKLALSMRGGGARTGAYLGVIKALEENNIKIDMLLGSSGGALIACGYACGRSIDEISDFLKTFRSRNFVSFHPKNRPFFISSEKVIKFAQKFVGDIDISETQRKLWVQATNTHSHTVEFFGKGPMATLAIASSAMPMIFKPVKYQGEAYIDGDITAGFGADFLRENGADVVIGLECKLPIKNGRSYGMYANIVEPVTIAKKRIREIDLKYNPVDLLISDLGSADIGILDYPKLPSQIKEGHDRATEIMSTICKFINS